MIFNKIGALLNIYSSYKMLFFPFVRMTLLTFIHPCDV